MPMLTEAPAGGALSAAVAARARLRWRLLTLSAVLALLTACSTPYLMQAASGEYHVLHERAPIDTVIADPGERRWVESAQAQLKTLPPR